MYNRSLQNEIKGDTKKLLSSYKATSEILQQIIFQSISILPFQDVFTFFPRIFGN